MFDLEKSIAEWQRQMLVAGIKKPVPLEELEIHLREEIERQAKSGLNEQNAFEISVQRIGEPQPLKSEFKKIERRFMKTMKIVGGIVSVMIGAALMVPGSIQLHDELVVANGKLVLWLLGLALCAWSLDLVRQITRPAAARQELEKTKAPMRKQFLKTSAGVIVLLTSLAFMMPAVAQAGRDGMMKFDDLCYLMFGLALLIAGALVTFWPYEKRKT
jgi:hypothetical protein